MSKVLFNFWFKIWADSVLTAFGAPRAKKVDKIEKSSAQQGQNTEVSVENSPEKSVSNYVKGNFCNCFRNCIFLVLTAFEAPKAKAVVEVNVDTTDDTTEGEE